MYAKHSRRRFFVDRLIQGRIVGRIAIYWVLYHVVLWHSLFVWRYVQYRSATLSGEVPQPFGELYGQFVSDYYALALLAIVTFPIFLFDIMRLTHRVAGPMVRFKNVMRAQLDGQSVSPVKLRSDDLLLPFQETFNEFTAAFESLRQASAAPSAATLTEAQADQIAAIVSEEPREASAERNPVSIV